MKDIVKIEKIVEQISETGSSVEKEKMYELIECAIVHSDKSHKIQLELYVMINGYHFNKTTLDKALSMIGGMKMNCAEIENAFRNYNISYSDELTIEDLSYAVHMMISDYHSLNLPEQTILKLAVAYCEDEDFPVKYGKCFLEWFNKVSLMKH